MKDMKLRIGELAVSINSSNMNILQYSPDDTSCWWVAYWKKCGSDGYSLTFVTDRPFHRSIDLEDFWKVAKFGQEYLNDNDVDRH